MLGIESEVMTFPSAQHLNVFDHDAACERRIDEVAKEVSGSLEGLLLDEFHSLAGERRLRRDYVRNLDRVVVDAGEALVELCQGSTPRNHQLDRGRPAAAKEDAEHLPFLDGAPKILLIAHPGNVLGGFLLGRHDDAYMMQLRRHLVSWAPAIRSPRRRVSRAAAARLTWRPSQ